jgi:hypothetical protein
MQTIETMKTLLKFKLKNGFQFDIDDNNLLDEQKENFLANKKYRKLLKKKIFSFYPDVTAQEYINRIDEIVKKNSEINAVEGLPGISCLAYEFFGNYSFNPVPLCSICFNELH